MTTSTTKTLENVKGVAQSGITVHAFTFNVQRVSMGNTLPAVTSICRLLIPFSLSRTGTVNVSKLPAICHLLNNDVTAHASCGARTYRF